MARLVRDVRICGNPECCLAFIGTSLYCSRRCRSRYYYLQHGDIFKRRSREWHHRTRPLRLQRMRRYRQEHLAEIQARNREWQRNHPEYDHAKAVRRRGQIAKPLNPLDWSKLKAFWGHRCAYCRRTEPLTQDHITPVSKGGEHTLSNIVPACQSCNSSKKDRTLSEFFDLLAHRNIEVREGNK